MGIETALIGGAIAGGAGGAIKGAKGTPQQVSTTTQTKDVAPASKTERELQSAALQNYFQNQNLTQATEDRLADLQGLQNQAQDVYGNVLSGQAFNLTPQEQANIAATRQALVQQGSEGVNRLLDERLQQVVNSGAGRGLRGQALGGLQGQVLKAGAQGITDIENQANVLAAQAAQNMPLQRINALQGFAGQGLSYADQLRQQAIQNREALSNPALLQALMNQRLAAAPVTQRTITPGKKGGLGSALLGGLGGAVSGATGAANLYGGLQNVGLIDSFPTDLRSAINPETTDILNRYANAGYNTRGLK